MTITDIKKFFSKNLKMYMELSGKKQGDIITLLGVSQATVSEWLSGKKYPRMDKVEKLAEYFNVTVSNYLANRRINHLGTTIQDTAEIAIEIANNPGKRVLFDALRHASPETLNAIKTLIDINTKRIEPEDYSQESDDYKKSNK